MNRRLFVASSLASLGLTACGPVKEGLTNGPFRKVLLSTEHLNLRVIGTHGMAREYRDQDVDREFRVNGLDPPSDERYASLAGDGFRDYRLVVDGLAERPLKLSLAELRGAALRTQITRHDCVEGWSAIGKWRGIPLATVLAMARPKRDARYCVFHCWDRDADGASYYESLDLHQAAHPQTMLALDLNDRPLDVAHGAPVRLRIPTQLGYKSAKWVRRIELAATLSPIAAGGGGYWEDRGYEWYAGI
ncbi:MAG: molybdopterin-dependent oxidoreductase [Candidatus Eremiobacteraeota bacterium]|nr:molybdopterin-dependent oxidoreductase [Candidatus Eremiobacteraeota bacterium]